MNIVLRMLGVALLVLVTGCAHGDLKRSANATPSTEEFVGSTLCENEVRHFLGGLGETTACHFVQWRLSITNARAGGPNTFGVDAQYHIPKPGNTNQSQAGPKAAFHGTWELLKGTGGRSNIVYRLKRPNITQTICFFKFGSNLLHLADSNGDLAVGNGGWSYTLNSARPGEKEVAEQLARTVPDMSYKISPMATGPTVFAVFEGRSPCHGIARVLNLPQHSACSKVKWRVTLYQNPETSVPTTYKVEGSLFRERPREGPWSITRGAATAPDATVYELKSNDGQPPLLLLKADENLLFFLNQNREPLVGNTDFSYTLNRLHYTR